MEAPSLRGLTALPSLSSSASSAAATPLRRLYLPRSLSRCSPRSAQALRIFASAGEQDTTDGNDRSPSSSFSGLSAEELEQKLGKRSRARKEKPSKAPDPKPAPKDWESMTIAEKAWDLYISEKGALFWLNKIAYAAIFVIVGGWIIFRFVGPALNLYQLDSPLLPPTEVLGGSK